MPGRPRARALAALAALAAAVASAIGPLAPPTAQAATTAVLGRSCPRAGATASAADGTRLVCVRINTGIRRWTPVTLSPVSPATTPPTTAAPARPAVRANPSGCVSEVEPGADLFPDKVVPEEASAWAIRYEKTYKVLTITNPWRGATTKPTYVLVQCGTKAPALEGDLRGATVITVPAARLSLMSTAQAAMAGVLGVAGAVVTVDEPNNYSTPAVVARIKDGAIRRSGFSGSANLEALVAARPDVVWANGSGTATDGLDRMRQAGLPVVVFADNMERTPLGRAEWVKVLAALTNTEAAATREWGSWAQSYRSLTARVRQTSSRPGAIAGSMFQGTWFMPGGQSYPAQLLRDAGASYAWSTDTSSGALALDFEIVIERAYDASYWINAGFSWTTLRDARAEDSRYSRLLPFQAGNAFANDRRVNATGGSDFFETGAIRPDLVLADLVSIFHPGLLPQHELVFYRRLPAA